MPINTTDSFVGATIPTVPGNVLKLMIAAARMTPQLPGNLTTLVFNDPLPPGQGTTWNSPKFGTFTAFSLTQGLDMVQQQALAATNVVITPGEVGVQAIFTEKALAQWSENVAVRAGQIMRNAMDIKKDIDIGGLFTGLDRSAGAAAEFLAIGHLTASVARLAGGTNTAGVAIAAGAGINVSEGPYIGVFRPESLHSLTRSIVGGGTGTLSVAVTGLAPGVGAGIATDVARGGIGSLFAGQIGGVDLYRNANLAKDANDDSIGAVFLREAMVYVPFNGADGTGQIRTQEDYSLRAIELNYVEDYGFGELDGNMGVAVTVDAITPTT